MEKLPGLKQLLNEAKEALIVELWQEIQKLSATLATYEPCAKSPSPKKTLQNSEVLIEKEYLLRSQAILLLATSTIAQLSIRAYLLIQL